MEMKPQNKPVPVPRDKHGHYLKGHTGNPGGRPGKAMSAYIHLLTDNGKKLVDKAMLMLKHHEFERQRFALTWLGERGFGRVSFTEDDGTLSGIEGGDIRRVILVEMNKNQTGYANQLSGPNSVPSESGETVPGQVVETGEPVQDPNKE